MDRIKDTLIRRYRTACRIGDRIGIIGLETQLSYVLTTGEFFALIREA